MITFLTIEVKIWWVLVGVVVFIAVFLTMLKLLYIKQQIEEDPGFLGYTKDIILEYEWKWHWVKDSWGKYKIDDLHPGLPTV